MRTELSPHMASRPVPLTGGAGLFIGERPVLTVVHRDPVSGQTEYVPAANVVFVPKGPGNTPVLYFDRAITVPGDRRIGFTRGVVTILNARGTELAEHILDGAQA
jgi:hypothetical protein